MENLIAKLRESYGFSGDIRIDRIEAGFLCTNYSVFSEGKKFFLKGYRFENPEDVADVHKVKTFFASRGIPVIVPIKTKSGETFFGLEAKYYALFPFVEGIHHLRGSIPPDIIRSLGELLARMHEVGKTCDFTIRAGFKGKNPATVLATIRQIKDMIAAKTSQSAFDRLALETLDLKLDLIQRDGRPAEALLKEPLILLQGDFHEQNIFFDEAGKVKRIFDFEKAQIGPRTFELWRSADYMFLNGNFSDDRIGNVIAYFKAYNAKNPISADELGRGLEVYYQRSIHGLWIEQEHYLKGNTKVDGFLENRTIRYLSENREILKRKIVEGMYGA